jgi:hypothetical protein
MPRTDSLPLIDRGATPWTGRRGGSASEAGGFRAALFYRVTEYLGRHPNRMFMRAFSPADACALFRPAWGNSARRDLAFDSLRLLAQRFAASTFMSIDRAPTVNANLRSGCLSSSKRIDDRPAPRTPIGAGFSFWGMTWAFSWPPHHRP